MDVDLSQMTRAELQALRKDIEKAEKDLAAKEKKAALAAAEAAAREHGYSLSDLTGGAAPSVPRYRNPDNPEQTWTGRGRKPKWVIAHIEAGKPVEDLEI